jgi:hypothetical protein
MIGEILYFLSAGVLGVFLGAQICEGALLVPYWKSMDAKDFFEMHKTYGKKIHQFFAPLTIVATIIPIATAIYSLVYVLDGAIFSLLMGVFTLLFFLTYFIYFKQANKRFSEASIPYQELPKELNRWGKWHWSRIGLELIAFIFSLVGLMLI